MKTLRCSLVATFILLCTVTWAAVPKYIFYFIGDGMGWGQVQALRTYFKSTNDTLASTMHFYDFPVSGIVSTYSADSEITDSAAAGTALACGGKTRNGMIGMDVDTVALTSIAKKMKASRRGVAVLSSVCIDDATPASFYASTPSRHNYYEIARQGASSGFDLLAGAYFRDPYGERAHTSGNVFAEYEAAGYTVVRGRDGYTLPQDASRVLWLDSDSATENTIGYVVDGDNGDMTLPCMVRAGIEYLYKRYPRGFFMMAEGGAIDHMGHSNDPSGLMGEMLQFDAAVREAYEFYKRHPRETLIIITADHETGGLSLGVEGSQGPALDNLQYAHLSKAQFSNDLRKLLKSKGSKATWSDVRQFIEKTLGLGSDITITPGEEGALMIALQEVMDSRGKDVKTLYANFDYLTNLIYILYSHKCGLGWTTYGHSGNPVPFFAIGAGAEHFEKQGWLENSAIPHILSGMIK